MSATRERLRAFDPTFAARLDEYDNLLALCRLSIALSGIAIMLSFTAVAIA